MCPQSEPCHVTQPMGTLFQSVFHNTLQQHQGATVTTALLLRISEDDEGEKKDDKKTKKKTGSERGLAPPLTGSGQISLKTCSILKMQLLGKTSLQGSTLAALRTNCTILQTWKMQTKLIFQQPFPSPPYPSVPPPSQPGAALTLWLRSETNQQISPSLRCSH